jgi:hypothetical protein
VYVNRVDVRDYPISKRAAPELLTPVKEVETLSIEPASTDPSFHIQGALEGPLDLFYLRLYAWQLFFEPLLSAWQGDGLAPTAEVR